jgi:LmbE family N-acetylglucosaminyl deacetylase
VSTSTRHSRSRRRSHGGAAGPRALAIAAHPDDIEFVMAGTLLMLHRAGWEIHYLNVATGNMGSMTIPPVKLARVRRGEARKACEILGATWHAPICSDLEIFYENRTLRRVCAVIRTVEPTVILTHSPQDYMEDHMIASRLAVTAAFARATPGYRTIPSRPPTTQAVTIYHASPHGMRDGLRRMVRPGAFVNTTSVHAQKTAALACHESQRRWLDTTQDMDDYVRTMDEFSRRTAKLSGVFHHAEGWRRHLHFGFCAEDADPLREALGRDFLTSKRYERALEPDSADHVRPSLRP